MEGVAWMDRAECSKATPQQRHLACVDAGEAGMRLFIELFCVACPVKTECELDYPLDAWNVRAGKLPRERLGSSRASGLRAQPTLQQIGPDPFSASSGIQLDKETVAAIPRLLDLGMPVGEVARELKCSRKAVSRVRDRLAVSL